FDYVSGKRAADPVRSGTIFWRSRPGRAFSKEVIRERDAQGKQLVRQIMIAAGPMWSQRLVERNGGDREGIVEMGQGLADQMDYNVAKDFCDQTGDPWSRVTDANSTVHPDSAGNLVLTLNITRS